MISDETKALLAKALPQISENKELALYEFCDEILGKISDAQGIDMHNISAAMSFLHKKGLISYRESYTQYGFRHLYKISANKEQIEEVLGTGGPFELVSLEDPQKRKRGRPRKQKYHQIGSDLKPRISQIPKKESPKKEKKNCCEKPKIVRNKKTGKRKCKNCGHKHPPKKIKGCCLNPRIVKNKKTGNRKCKNCGFRYPPKKKKLL